MLDISVKLQLLEERFSSKTEKAYIKSLDDALTIILGKLAKIENVDEIRRLNALKSLIEKEISGLYNDMKPYTKEDMQDFAELQYKTQFDYINEKAKLGYAFAALPKDTIKELTNLDAVFTMSDKGYTLNDIFETESRSQIKKYMEIIRGGLGANDGYRNIAKRISEENGKSVQSMRQVVALAVGQARDKVNIKIYDDIFSDVITGWESVATLDSSTTLQCATLGGKKYMKPKYTYETIPNRPKRHRGCRSILKALTTFDTPTQRPENGDDKGQVSSTVKFKDWFATQSASFQRAYLGDARYKLYKEDRFSISDFVDVKTGRRFTIEELKSMF